MDTMAHTQARLLRLEGRVQGVGFRPFVYRIARAAQLTGWVRNRDGAVEIRVEGPPERLDAFVHGLLAGAPPLARPRLVHSETVARENHDAFVILQSTGERSAHASVPPDLFTCDDCLAEMRDPAARRHRYPFINCTQCGPRYTLIRRLPYDRPNTAMDAFPLCPACRSEYENPLDRRFHAQPLACPVCGPQLHFVQGNASADADAALDAAVAALRAGAIVAVKGVGGYHLLCDARDAATIARLRLRKPRPHKPLAVMFPQTGEDGLTALRADLSPTPEQAALVLAPERPIVLCTKSPRSTLADNVAPGLDEVGAMLPYSPLHHLLLDAFDAPLVATSGNLGGEPVLTDEVSAATRLAHIADAFLHHNRPILRPADDSVFRFIAGKPRPVRVGRGLAPSELKLPCAVPEPIIALGGHTKNTVALAVGDRAIVSPHIGDLDAPRAREVFARVVEDLQTFYGVRAARLVCDAHPHYASTRWARTRDLPITSVFHHHAHASALYGEHDGTGDWLVFAWDGVGLGEDGTLWGGEALLGAPGRWRRVARLRPFRLPGGERAGREPWRSAAGVCWELGLDYEPPDHVTALLHDAWARGHQSPLTTAVGRLFDAAAALTGVLHTASFEGQGPMLLEAAAAKHAPALPLPVTPSEGLLEIDWAPLVPMLRDAARPLPERSAIFHASLAEAIQHVARTVAAQTSFTDVGLTGGVFQNRRLGELAHASLSGAGFICHLPGRIPGNDGGISYGQIIEAAARTPR